MLLRVRCLCCDDNEEHVVRQLDAPSPPKGSRPVIRSVRDAKRDERRKEERRWQRAKKGTADYARRLRKIADQVDALVRAIPPDDPPAQARLEQLLHRYADLIDPWAKATAARMIAETSLNDEAMWATLSKEMGLGIRQELARAPTGALLKERLDENVELITSLPRDAAKRVHKLALERLENSGRANEIADEIMKTGEVTRSRANLIARTEVARVASGLIEVRAQHIGSEGYIWRTAMDSEVRNTDGNPVGSHRLLEGKFIRWDSPPVAATNGTRAHAGQIYNCRCYPEPVIPEELGGDPERQKSEPVRRPPEPARATPKPMPPKLDVRRKKRPAQTSAAISAIEREIAATRPPDFGPDPEEANAISIEMTAPPVVQRPAAPPPIAETPAVAPPKKEPPTLATWSKRENATPALAEFREKSRDRLLEQGRRTGRESLTGFDVKTGAPLGGKIEQNASKNFVGFTPELIAQIENPKNAIELHHNHPSDMSLSQQDLFVVESCPGLAKVYAHGHKGSTYSVRAVRPGGSRLHKKAKDAIYSVLDRGYPEITPDDKGRLTLHAVLTALDSTGAVSDYEAVLAPDLATLVETRADLFSRLVETAKAAISRRR